MIRHALPALLLLALVRPALAEGLAVGVLVPPGSDAAAGRDLVGALEQDPGLRVRAVGLEGLAEVRVLVVAGASGTELGEALGPDGAAALTRWVQGGGGYLGLGGGAWLGCRGYNAATRSLELVDAWLVDRGGWEEREGEVELRDLAPELADARGPWWFSRGPLFAPALSHGRAPYASWGRFASDLGADDPERRGLMPGLDAIVAAPCGAGRAVLFAVRPEARPGTAPALGAAIRWAAGGGAAAPATPAAPPDAIKVAVLDDEGCIGDCVQHTFRCLDPSAGFWVRRVDGRDVRAGALSGYDVVLLPGGSATGQSGGLGPEGRQALVEAVASGTGYVGTCAGAYLAAVEPRRYGLGLAAVRCVDTKHWRRGTGRVELSATAAFAELTGLEGERQELLYANGPLLEPLAEEGLPPVEPLLVFRSDLHQGEAPAGVMPGKLAGLRTTYRDGRVVLFSVHPELSPGYEPALVRAVRWAARRGE